MRKWLIGALAVAMAVAAMPPSILADDDDDEGWEFHWSNGFKLESPDGDHSFKFGGRIQADATFVADQDMTNLAVYGPIEDANEFRRARLFFEGKIYRRIKFKSQVDFAGGDVEVKDVYIEFIDTPIGNVRFGHFKEPFSLEELTSSKYIAFLERSTNNMFAPGRNMGVMVHDSRGDKVNWAAGAFRESDDFGTTGDASRGRLNLTCRVAGRPWYADDGRRMVHLGLSASVKDLGVDAFDFDTRPGIHQGPRFVDTGGFTADEVLIYDLEAAVIVDRFWAAAEYMMADADTVSFTTSDPSFDGHYVQAGYFLTDDRKPYKTSSGTFDRLEPNRNFGYGGAGAWEVAVRYGMVDLGDAILNSALAGELDDITLALNWYPNPATRVMLNYIMAESELGGVDAGSADFVTLRMQVDF